MCFVLYCQFSYLVNALIKWQPLTLQHLILLLMAAVSLRPEVGPGLGSVQPGQELMLLLQPLSDEEYLGHADCWGSLHCIASRSFSPQRWDPWEMLSVRAAGNYWDQGEQRAANTVCHLWLARGERHEGRPLWVCLYNCTLTSTGTGESKIYPSFPKICLWFY